MESIWCHMLCMLNVAVELVFAGDPEYILQYHWKTLTQKYSSVAVLNINLFMQVHTTNTPYKYTGKQVSTKLMSVHRVEYFFADEKGRNR